MNQKLYSIFLSVLLASTFVHEIQSKSYPNAAAIAAPRPIPQIFERAAVEVPQNCYVVCNPINTNITILANVKANLVAFANISANVALIVDINANLAALLNGKTGSAIVLKLATNEVVYIPSGAWSVANGSFADYLASLTSGLSVLLKLSGAVTYKVGSVPQNVLSEINALLVFLVANISSAVQNDAKVGLQIIIAICVKKVEILKGPLNGFVQLVGSTRISIKADLAEILNSCEGLSVVIGKISGGLSGLVKLGVTLDLQAYISLSNGVDRLVYIIVQLAGKVDLGAALGGLLNTNEALFNLIALLGGNSNAGITGLFKVLATIVACINKKVQIEVVITVVILFLAYTSQSASGDLTATLTASLKALLSAIEKAGATKALASLVATLKGLIAGTLTIGGVNISKIVQILLTYVVKGVGFLLQALILVVIELVALIETVLGLLYCLLVLIIQCNSPLGINVLKLLGINIDLSLGGVVGSILNFILQSVGNIIKLLLGDLYGALVTVPVIGQIIAALNAAIKSATGGKYDLQVLLNANNLIKNLIKGLIQVVANINLFISSSVQAQVKGMLQACTSVNLYLGINVSVVIGVAI